MSTSVTETSAARVADVAITNDTLAVTFCDGRSILIPLTWYPRLVHATPQERNHWRLLDDGRGIHWEDVDEDISVANLLAGRPSGESVASFARWREARKQVKA